MLRKRKRRRMWRKKSWEYDGKVRKEREEVIKNGEQRRK